MLIKSFYFYVKGYKGYKSLIFQGFQIIKTIIVIQERWNELKTSARKISAAKMKASINQTITGKIKLKWNTFIIPIRPENKGKVRILLSPMSNLMLQTEAVSRQNKFVGMKALWKTLFTFLIPCPNLAP